MERSPLGRLPPELRNHICELVLVSPEPMRLYIPKIWGQSMHVKPRNSSFKLPPRQSHWGSNAGFLRTCKEIHAEATAMFFETNTFVLETPGMTALEDTQRFLKVALTTRTRQMLRSISVEVYNLKDLHADDIHLLVVLVHDCLRTMPKCEVVIKYRFSTTPGLDHIHRELRLTSGSSMSEAATPCYKAWEAASASCEQALMADIKATGTCGKESLEVTNQVERFDQSLDEAWASLFEAEDPDSDLSNSSESE